MTISEIAFNFSKVLNQIRHQHCGAKISTLQRYVRDEMFYSIKNRIPAQEYYQETKMRIESELSIGNYVA